MLSPSTSTIMSATLDIKNTISDNVDSIQWYKSHQFTQSFDLYGKIRQVELSTATEQLGDEVEKILDDIDSGKVKMVDQTADEFIADMKNDLAAP